ncbi:hypothetical protein NOF04DRAFT_1030177 [Fusarium oxysporum II5]|uniref:PH domain-containing protein n=3 Tax=Fusarium oxysporum species complex TaxID=171631 RepID=N1REW6_FUSC4|nr:uncharacterized protein FOIG_08085 [Fusarium odoratissimum NRRL 54006]EMT60675.1 hypothetical protein FOC4_g10011952 [Fusarium odoratissimum]EXM00011.1 hypothetical protein FOIG_08085 [Fusarium odoratissimum NRRL 54006]KAK2135597.1 hypothetical protein NOF04DRAFT_1030177 [Fusarium oxysporum II5]
MSFRDSFMTHSGTLEALQSHHAPARRTRPPDIDTMAAEENRVPLKAEKASRRESRLGLRSLFSRSKTHLASPETPSSFGSRTSLPETNPYFPAQPDPVFDDMPSSPRSPRPLATMFESQQSPPAQPRPVGLVRTQGSGKPARGPLSTWHPPPLFKAFPQAVKHMTLPATSLAPEAILRMHERRASTLRDENAEAPDAEGAPTEKAKVKKKHRRNTSGHFPKFEWTNKIYVLVTSGYLLQYAAEGPFDRLPERILHLSKDSAAFASDVIPGRHWVIQVSAAAESDGTTASDSRSLFSRWNFRATERRHVSNFLMVFETAEDMEGWISTLRREIEALGGKKTLTETGKPKAEDEVAPLREKPSQRTLVVRDPNRLSRIASSSSQSPQSPDSFLPPQNLQWQSQTQINRSATNVAEPEPAVDQPLDDNSTTNSFVSHDGRQLESLRENSNRLSFISSGQRTVVTSAGSSPASSPTVDTFPAPVEHKSSLEEAKLSPEPKPRPNAAAILDRRQSMQVLTPFVELQGGPINLRPQSSYGSGAADLKTPTPNFSVPNSSNRRYSYAKTMAQEFGMAPSSGPLEVRSLGRRAPPTTLPIARPLSMVADQPSPMEDVHERPVTRHGDETQPTIPVEDDLPSLPNIPTSYEMTSRHSSLVPIEEPTIEISRPGSSRRQSDMRQWRKSENPNAMGRSIPNSTRPSLEQRTRSRSFLGGAEEAARRRASLDTHSDARSDSMSAKARSQRRASIQSVMSDRASQYSASGDLPPPMSPESLPLPAPPPTVPLPPIPASASNPLLRPDMNGKSLFIRRSMPHLGEVPPPVPPPTCALPPLPPKIQVKA